ncbi:DUF3502 domain-containing protein [Paenibacillus roseipurpureus]|uniref:DUF3502 domain-containing protein n=1 Tax=Paenibacillus roseopurpureus TaxID=2918901 RepID=A0AA96RLD3_9BACL|nr:DUF3502 domain-containing protein [Paenibacillus sp. MBLB1832]WNR45246.1 DUF3502 domain-containing protein [Paenibacillus sp. MBLB1832]
MKKTKTSLVAKLMLVSLSSVLVLSACSKSTTTTGSTAPSPTASAASELKPVDLVWYYPTPKDVPDVQLVEDELNKITKAKINATIKLKPVLFGNYDQKMNTVIAANEDVDIVWTSSWNFKFDPNFDKGAFLKLDDLINKYAPTVKKTFTDTMWDSVKKKGEIYTIPSYQTMTRVPGFTIQKRFVDKYNFDITKVKKLEDLEPLLEQIKKNEPGIVPFASDNRGFFSTAINGIGEDGGIAYYKKDPTKAIDYVASPEYKQYLETVHKWFAAGYINQDAPTLKSFDPIRAKGAAAVYFNATSKPGGEADDKLKGGGFDVVYVTLGEPMYTGANTTMNAIAKSSKNPERAMMFLELVNSNKDIFNLLGFGIENKHYKKTGNNAIKIDSASGYSANAAWVFGNVTNGYLLDDQPADTWERTIKLNTTSKVTANNGFNWDGAGFKTEEASLNSINEEYSAALSTGAIDPAVKYQEFLDKRIKAGEDRKLGDQQKQLGEWLKTKK